MSKSSKLSNTPCTENQNQTEEVQTLQEQAPDFECEISEYAKVEVSRGIFIEPKTGELIDEDTYGKPIWDTLETDDYWCSCGESFESEEKAVRHLKRQYWKWMSKYSLPRVTSPALENVQPPTFSEKVELDENGFSVTYLSDESESIGLVTEGLESLLQTSRRKFSLPSDFDFESWKPLNGGKLCYPSENLKKDREEQRIRPWLLKKGVVYLNRNGTRLDGDLFTLYDRGDRPFVLTGRQNAIAIAPLTPSSSIFK